MRGQPPIISEHGRNGEEQKPRPWASKQVYLHKLENTKTVADVENFLPISVNPKRPANQHRPLDWLHQPRLPSNALPVVISTVDRSPAAHLLRLLCFPEDFRARDYVSFETGINIVQCQIDKVFLDNDCPNRALSAKSCSKTSSPCQNRRPTRCTSVGVSFRYAKLVLQRAWKDYLINFTLSR